jgi:hypothetical protein
VISDRLPPLRGIFHAAGVLDDGLLTSLTWQRFANVLRPKVQGTWNLHVMSLKWPVEHFVMFSSVTGLFGRIGQVSSLLQYFV